jgi:hypothetical protein
MNVMRYTSMGLGSVLAAALLLTGCDDKKENGEAKTDAPASSASATASGAPAASGAPSASAASSAAANAPEEKPADTADQKLATDEVFDHHRYHHASLTKFIAMALDTMGVPAERKAAVDKIQHELDTRMAPVHEADQVLLGKLADGVAAGKVEAAKTNADLAKVESTATEARKTSAELITQLHAALTPVERATLVDKVQAHWDVWREANADAKGDKADKKEDKKEEKKDDKADKKEKAADKKEEKKDDKADKVDHGRLAKLTSDLELTPEQVDKIEAGLKTEPGGAPGPVDAKLATDIDARVKAFSTSFSGETFDAKTLAAGDAVDAHLVTTGVSRLVRLCEVATPILTPEQRTKFATHLREHKAEAAAKDEKEKEKGAAK